LTDIKLTDKLTKTNTQSVEIVSVTESTDNKCSNCSNENPIEAKFCKRCGNIIRKISKPVIEQTKPFPEKLTKLNKFSNPIGSTSPKDLTKTESSYVPKPSVKEEITIKSNANEKSDIHTRPMINQEVNQNYINNRFEAPSAFNPIGI
jgi:hypothetical protein